MVVGANPLLIIVIIIITLASYQTVLRLREVTAVITPCGSFLPRMSILKSTCYYHTAQEGPFVCISIVISGSSISCVVVVEEEILFLQLII